MSNGLDIQDVVKNNVGWVVLISIFMIPFMGLAANNIAGTSFNLQGSSGLCVNSMNEISYNSNQYDYDDGTAWKFTFSDSCNEKIVGGGGEVPAEEMEGQTEDGKTIKAASAFTLTMDYQDAWFAETPPTTHKIPVLENTVQRKDTKQQAENWLGDQSQYFNSGIIKKDQPWSLNTDYVAWKEKKKGYVLRQTAGATETGMEATIKLCSQGECDSEQITKQSTTAILEKDGHDAKITYEGSRLSSLRDINIDGIEYVEDNAGNVYASPSWAVEAYEETSTDFDTEQCIEDEEYGDVLHCQGKYDNNIFRNDFSSIEQSVENSPAVSDVDVSWVEGQLRTSFTNPREVENPLFAGTMDEGWLGVVYEAPKPSLGNLDNIQIYKGEQAKVRVPVENTGEKSGNMDVNMDCNGGLGDSSRSIYIDSGETRNVDLDISSVRTSVGTYTCTVTAEAGRAKDSTQMGVTVKEKCQDCGVTPGGGSSGGGETTIIEPGDEGIAWANVGIAALIISLIAGITYYRNKIGEALP